MLTYEQALDIAKSKNQRLTIAQSTIMPMRSVMMQARRQKAATPLS